jgi:hypothetical protein
VAILTTALDNRPYVLLTYAFDPVKSFNAIIINKIKPPSSYVHIHFLIPYKSIITVPPYYTRWKYKTQIKNAIFPKINKKPSPITGAGQVLPFLLDLVAYITPQESVNTVPATTSGRVTDITGLVYLPAVLVPVEDVCPCGHVTTLEDCHK